MSNINNLQIFRNEEFGEIRTVDVGGKSMFCLVDICKALDLTQPSKVKERLNADGVNTIPTIDSLGRTQNALFINESNLYKVIFQSRKESAERFTDWVTSEVLPSIRRSGGYIFNQENMTAEQILAAGLKIAQNIIDEQKKEMGSLKKKCDFLGGQNIEQQKLISELRPKANYVDAILKNKSLVLTTQIAKDYGMSARNFNNILHKLGVQYKANKQWVLYAKYQAYGYVHSKTYEFSHRDGTEDVRMQTEWTQKGRLFLYELLKQHGYIPVIEQGM